MFSIRVTHKDGRNLSYLTALRRGMRVFFSGLAGGLPLIMLITMGNAYGSLESTGKTSWDHGTDQIVTHRRLHLGKATLGLLLIALSAAAHFYQLFKR